MIHPTKENAMVAKTKTRTAAPAFTMGALIDAVWASREKKRQLQEQIKEIETVIAEYEKQLMERMTAEGTDKAQGSKAGVSISTNTVANVEDWDAFWAFVIKKKYTHLLQRRVSDPAYRELLEAGQNVPGVEPFTKRTLNVRSL